jgi:hypothetical protein
MFCAHSALAQDAVFPESAKMDVVDAPVLGSGATEIEFGYQFFYGESSGPEAAVSENTPRHSHSDGTAHLALTYGVSGRVDLCAALCWCEMQEHGTSSSGGAGLGDAALGVKYLALEARQFTVSLSAMLQTPLGVTVGAGGLAPGSQAWTMTPSLIGSFSEGRLSIACNIAAIFPIGAPEIRGFQYGSAAVGYQLSGGFQPVVEALMGGGLWSDAGFASVSAGAVCSLSDALRITVGLRQVLEGHALADRGGFVRMASTL